ncbi:DNA-directed RNA polymerase specialized sigma subunit, sigma24 homolog [Serpentinimonas maccroryi]|uniref:DNA-directed RNA polymerase specialized sigma subunit, sigma24 homolog n=1 Tax=Serpentinimonas maccroryi TaxID=1458426 RepID=A0A060NPH9_9BURK|nr:RNA polymerase sigma factor [Serpentinimonas maccroryi]BAO84471.1 DNA-directed RNA polymerase specialized sigma subunit, sigma24 homolog [Serpentinimonas maccroryi]
MASSDPRAELISLLPRLRRFAYGLTGDGHQADDLVQAGCLKAIERWSQYQGGTSLASWLFRILQTTWLDEYRTRQRQQTDSWDEGFEELMGDDGTSLLEARSEARAVRRLVAELPEDQRAVLMLVAVEGLSYKEAAEVLELPLGTVMSRLARARARLAEGLGAKGR